LSGTEIVVLSLAAVCLFLTAVVVVLAARVARFSRPGMAYSAFEGPAFTAAVARDLKAVAERLSQAEAGLGEVRGILQSSIRHVGIVRYDAFRDMGGHMSFSLALLDGRRDGVVLSVLNGRDGSRGYAKPVSGGKSPTALSEEEQEALAQALDLARVR
jgi:hypothetical protein